MISQEVPEWLVDPGLKRSQSASLIPKGLDILQLLLCELAFARHLSTISNQNYKLNLINI